VDSFQIARNDAIDFEQREVVSGSGYTADECNNKKQDSEIHGVSNSDNDVYG